MGGMVFPACATKGQSGGRYPIRDLNVIHMSWYLMKPDFAPLAVIVQAGIGDV